MSKPSNLALRLISALTGAVLLVTLIAWHPGAFLAAFLIIGVASAFEYFRMSGWFHWALWTPHLLVLILAIVLGYWAAAYGHGMALFRLVPLIFLSFIGTLFSPNQDGFRKVGVLAFFHLYFTSVFILAMFVVFQGGTYYPGLMIGLFLCTWGLDSGAYFAGSYLGKHKLFPSISPKKTWEGAAGGMLLSMVGGWISSLFFPELSLSQWLVFSLVVGVSGIFGDLVESMLKRSSAVKDSGTIIPGHGGFLDRFDSLFMSIPFIWTYLKFFVFP